MTIASAVGCMVTMAACGPDDSPEEAVRQFRRATAAADRAAVYELLTPKTQQQLQQMAQLATAQTGGTRRFRPHDLLAASLTRPSLKLGRTEVRRVSEDVVRVCLVEAEGKHEEPLTLQRFDGRWRVHLPQHVQDMLGPGTRSSSRPAHLRKSRASSGCGS